MIIPGNAVLKECISLCHSYNKYYNIYEIAIIRFTNEVNLNKNYLKAAKVSTVQKLNALNRIGYRFRLYEIDIIDKVDFENLLKQLNLSTTIKAILIQRPIPLFLSSSVLLIDKEKDIDNLTGDGAFKSCSTSESIIRVLKLYIVRGPQKKHLIAVVGGKGFVGRNVVSLLEELAIEYFVVEKGDSLSLIRDATFVITATGQGNLLSSKDFTPEQIVIDAGFSISSENDNKYLGDVDREAYFFLKGITPVPNGIGPLNISVLLERLIKMSCNADFPDWETFWKI